MCFFRLALHSVHLEIFTNINKKGKPVTSELPGNKTESKDGLIDYFATNLAGQSLQHNPKGEALFPKL